MDEERNWLYLLKVEELEYIRFTTFTWRLKSTDVRATLQRLTISNHPLLKVDYDPTIEKVTTELLQVLFKPSKSTRSGANFPLASLYKEQKSERDIITKMLSFDYIGFWIRPNLEFSFWEQYMFSWDKIRKGLYKDYLQEDIHKIRKQNPKLPQLKYLKRICIPPFYQKEIEKIEDISFSLHPLKR